MKIHSTLQIGSFHLNHCEDHAIITTIGEGRYLTAVMDGCTMGEDSVFASVLLGKMLKNSARKYDYLSLRTSKFLTLSSLLKEILKEVFTGLKSIKNQLGLNTNELLSTLIVGIIDENSQSAELIVIGDGLICVDGNYYEYEQGDKPDYVAYHLNKQFEDWYGQQQQFLSVKSFRDLSICTDGIYSFRNFSNSQDEKQEAEIKAFLFEDNEGIENDRFLDNKILFLKEEWQYSPGDDIAIVRVIEY